MEKLENNLEKKEINNNEDIPSRKPKKIIEERDTTGDTKVFQIIKKEDIEREKRKQAAIKENQNIVPQKIEENKEEKKYNNYQEKNKNVKLNDYQSNNKKQEIKQQSEAKPVQKDNQKKIKSKNTSKKILTFLLILIILILVVTIFSTIFALIGANSNTMIKGLKINNIEVSNMTKEQVFEKLQEELTDNEKNFVIVKRGEYSKEIKLSDISGTFKIEESVNAAYNIGRDSNILNNNYKTLSTMIKGQNVEVPFLYEEEMLDKIINDISIDIPELATEVSYIIEGDKLIIKNSNADIQINKEEFKKQVINIFSNPNVDDSFELPTEQAKKKEIDIEKIYKQVYKQPVNAYYTTEPRKVYKEEEGIDFAITLDEAKQLLSEDKIEYEIPLKKIQPQIKVSDLDQGAYPDLLSTFTTYYGTADANRNTNIALAARSINSVVLMPGEVFSYNTLIGDCSPRSGYKAATIYLNGELSTGIGGGICQVSTTLYNSVLRANLEIVQRRNHSLGVTYVPAGQDAMVSIGSSDFQFKNNRDYPVKVVAYTGTGSVTCQIYGLKQATEYEVKLQSRTIEKNEQKYKVETYKVLYLNGKEVSRTWLSTDTYKYHQ